MITLSLSLSIAARRRAAGGATPEAPDSGYVFLFLADGRQVFLADGRAVQVPDSMANS